MRAHLSKICLFLFVALAGTCRADTWLVLSAVPQETVPVRVAMANPIRGSYAGIDYESGMIGSHHVVAALTGVGKVDAAMVSTALALQFHPSAIWWTGTSARVLKTLRVGDVIIATKVMHYDSGRETRDGMAHDFYGYPGSPWSETTGSMVLAKDFRDTRSAFACDPKLVALAQAFAARYQPEAVTLAGATYIPKVRTGFIVTGDLSNLRETHISEIRDSLGPDQLSMEAASIGQVCTFLHIPFLVITGGSDLLQENNPDDYALLSPIAARQAALFTVALFRQLP